MDRYHTVHPEELFDLRQVKLMKLSKLWIALMKPSQEEIQRIEEGAHSAAVDAKMTREIFVIVMKFREKHSAIFDMMSPVDMDRAFYKTLMNAAFDRETRGPVGGIRHGVEAKRLRQVLRTNALHDRVCDHAPYIPR